MSLSLIIDLVIIAIVLLFTFLGYKRGFVKLAIRLCTFFIAIVVAFMLYKPAAKLVITNTEIDEKIENTITSKLLTEGSAEDTKVEKKDLPSIILKSGENTVKNISNSIAVTLIEVACLLVIFILMKIALKFVTALADLIAKLPLLKQINKLGGTVYGIIEGLFIIFVGFAIISLISPMLDVSFISQINSSTLGAICYNNNILLEILM